MTGEYITLKNAIVYAVKDLKEETKPEEGLVSFVCNDLDTEYSVKITIQVVKRVEDKHAI